MAGFGQKQTSPVESQYVLVRIGEGSRQSYTLRISTLVRFAMRAPLLLLLLLLTACGGGSESPSPQPLPLRDTTPPVITITGDNPQVITTGSDYTELGATATDNLDGDVSGSIVINASDVNTNVAADYMVTYTVTDAAGNLSTVARTVRVENPPLPAEPQVTVIGEFKKFVFSWANVDGADYYRLLENADGHSGFSQVGNDIPAGTLSVTRDIAVHLTDFVNGQFIIDACNVSGCTSSDVVTATEVMLDTIGYFKASNTDAEDHFGSHRIMEYYGLNMALSADGNTLAVGAPWEDSSATGIDGNEADNSADDAGAVYVYRRSDTGWRQEAYLKASNTDAGDVFGFSVALSGDGNRLAAGAPGEDSGSSGIDSDSANDLAAGAGAVYLFEFDGAKWQQRHYIKQTVTSVADRLDENQFGSTIAMSSAGDVLAIGAPGELSICSGIDPSDCTGVHDDSIGAIFVLRETASSGWAHEVFLKGRGYPNGGFGSFVAVSGDGTTLVAGAADWNFKASPETTFVYRHDGLTWVAEAELIGSNTADFDMFHDGFGRSVAVNFDGTTVAVGAPNEQSASTEINGDETDNSRGGVGAVYLFRFANGTWGQQAYLKPSTISAGLPGQWSEPFSEALFGSDISLDASGNLLAVGAIGQNSGDTGVGADKNDHSAQFAGAVFLFSSDSISWRESAFIKAPNTDAQDRFGGAVSLSEDGSALAVGAYGEDSAGIGIDADQDDNSVEDSGAVYIY